MKEGIYLDDAFSTAPAREGGVAVHSWLNSAATQAELVQIRAGRVLRELETHSPQSARLKEQLTIIEAEKVLKANQAKQVIDLQIAVLNAKRPALWSLNPSKN